MTSTSSPPEPAVAVASDAGAGARPAPPRWFLAGLGGITLGGLVLRIVNVLVWRPTVGYDTTAKYKIGGDANYYHYLANALAKGVGFVDPVLWHNTGRVKPSAYHPPLYSTYLAVFSKLGFDGVTDHRLASCLLGATTVAVIGWVAFDLAGPRAGLVAASLAALYPMLWINDGMLLSESMAALTVALGLWATFHFARRPGWGRAALMGAVWGLGLLSRTELVLVFPVIVLPVVLLRRERSWGDRLRMLAAAAVAAIVVVGPWVGYNLTRFDRPVLVVSGGGSALSAASCDEVYYGRFIGYYANCFQGPWPPASADESVRDEAPRRQARSYIFDHKRRVPLVAVARVGRIWGVFKPGQTTWLDWWLEGRGRAASWAGLLAYYAIVPFAIGGLVVLHRRRVTIIPLLGIVGITTFSAASFFGVTRYRVPSEVVLVVAAGIGAERAWTLLRRPRAATAAPDVPTRAVEAPTAVGTA